MKTSHKIISLILATVLGVAGIVFAFMGLFFMAVVFQNAGMAETGDWFLAAGILVGGAAMVAAALFFSMKLIGKKKKL